MGRHAKLLNNPETNLGDLLPIFLSRRKRIDGKLTLERGRQIVDLLRANATLEEMTKKVDVCKGTLSSYFREIKQAAEKGYTLERYYAEGRPFRYGKQVLKSAEK